MHRRSVFEPPRLRFDDPPYTFDTLEVLIFTKSDENTAPAMLLEPPWIPLDTPKDHQKPVTLSSPRPSSSKPPPLSNYVLLATASKPPSITLDACFPESAAARSLPSGLRRRVGWLGSGPSTPPKLPLQLLHVKLSSKVYST